VTNQTKQYETEWQKFLKHYRIQDIKSIEGSGFDVISNSGKTYRVISQMGVSRDTGSYYFTMKCNCPAYKRCRHIDAVEQMRYAEAIVNQDYDEMEILERMR
jgi:hypothetical protein